MNASFSDLGRIVFKEEINNRSLEGVKDERVKKKRGFTWLAETSVSVRLVDANAVNAGGRIASGQFFLAVETNKARRARAMSTAIVSDQAGAPIMANHRIAGIELLFAKLAFVA